MLKLNAYGLFIKHCWQILFDEEKHLGPFRWESVPPFIHNVWRSTEQALTLHTSAGRRQVSSCDSGEGRKTILVVFPVHQWLCTPGDGCLWEVQIHLRPCRAVAAGRLQSFFHYFAKHWRQGTRLWHFLSWVGCRVGCLVGSGLVRICLQASIQQTPKQCAYLCLELVGIKSVLVSFI